MHRPLLPILICVAACMVTTSCGERTSTPVTQAIDQIWSNYRRGPGGKSEHAQYSRQIEALTGDQWPNLSSDEKDVLVVWATKTIGNNPEDWDYAFVVRWALVFAAAKERDVAHLADLIESLPDDLFWYSPLEHVFAIKFGPDAGTLLLLDVAEHNETTGRTDRYALHAVRRALSNCIPESSHLSVKQLRESVQSVAHELAIDPSYEKKRRSEWDGIEEPPSGMLMRTANPE